MVKLLPIDYSDDTHPVPSGYLHLALVAIDAAVPYGT